MQERSAALTIEPYGPHYLEACPGGRIKLHIIRDADSFHALYMGQSILLSIFEISDKCACCIYAKITAGFISEAAQIHNIKMLQERIDCTIARKILLGSLLHKIHRLQPINN